MFEYSGADRRIIGGFEDRSSLIHFIKHGNVNHFRSRFYSAHELQPVKFSTVARNPGFFTVRMHIVPAESRKYHRRIVQVILPAPENIFPDPAFENGISFLIESSDQPGPDDI